MRIYCLLLIMAATLCLQGCMDVATSGAQAVYNRRTIEKNVTDQYITMRAYQALHFKTEQFKNANISIATLNNDVLLAGQVPEDWQREKAAKIVQTIPEVDRVYNLLQIKSPSSSLTRMSDAWITAKVKAKLIASNDLDASQIKVVTENGTVYLMGTIKPDEARAASEIAGTTEGVESVVRLFYYIHITRKMTM